jgi:amino acid transporter
MASYIITISCILIHRLRGSRLPPTRFSLGKHGVWVNIFALIYLTPVFIFSFFPVSPNPTPSSMNWACAMVGGVALLATVYYVIWGRKTYTPPNEVVEDYIKRNEDQDMPTSSEKEVSGGVAEESVD